MQKMDRLLARKMMRTPHMQNEVNPAAFVLRKEEGQHVGAGALNLDGATISVAEVVALKEGLLFARHKGVKQLMVEEDSKLVIQVVQDVWMPLWHLKPIIKDIKWLASEFQHISWKHIFIGRLISWRTH
ncbi:uncharacterized protein LOC126609088 [Malus sylvestris]|uniref:uncharacterized protein LOC126609088 n=1 Tax=Malus sylvestris TaxID=3752 RepID=UPI0021AC2698|nr:uncharacterized protein LOC126609088 [Malus sylvestris]